MNWLKTLTQKILPRRISNILKELLGKSPDYFKSYSQEGEDMVLKRFFGKQRNGFYVDVGAYQPRKFSNTCHFYELGWRGINIDAMPGSMKVFMRERPRDSNLELAIADTTEPLEYYLFEEQALNGFSKSLSELKAQTQAITGTKKITPRPLREVLEQHVPADTHIDFLSVDAEGADLSVLQSNDWTKYRPTLVLAEEIGGSFTALATSPIVHFMEEQGYEIVAKTAQTLIFKIKP